MKNLIVYRYIVMSQRDMFENQVLEEILREKTNYYLTKNKSIDFWIIPAPSFLNDKQTKEKIESTNFFRQQKNQIQDGMSSNFYAAIVSLDNTFLQWLKLRLGYFEDLETVVPNEKQVDCVSDGFFGQISVNSHDLTSLIRFPLRGDKFYIHPQIVSKKIQKSLEIYYSLSQKIS